MPVTSGDKLCVPVTSGNTLCVPVTSGETLCVPVTSVDTLWVPVTLGDTLCVPVTSGDTLCVPVTCGDTLKKWPLIRYWRGLLNRMNAVKLSPFLNTETSRHSVHVGTIISSSNQADLLPQNLPRKLLHLSEATFYVFSAFCFVFITRQIRGIELLDHRYWSIASKSWNWVEL